MGAAATSAAPVFIDTPNMKIESLTPLQKAVWKACQNQVDNSVKKRAFRACFPALFHKSLIIDGVGEGNLILILVVTRCLVHLSASYSSDHFFQNARRCSNVQEILSLNVIKT